MTGYRDKWVLCSWAIWAELNPHFNQNLSSCLTLPHHITEHSLWLTSLSYRMSWWQYALSTYTCQYWPHIYIGRSKLLTLHCISLWLAFTWYLRIATHSPLFHYLLFEKTTHPFWSDTSLVESADCIVLFCIEHMYISRRFKLLRLTLECMAPRNTRNRIASEFLLYQSLKLSVKHSTLSTFTIKGKIYVIKWL